MSRYVKVSESKRIIEEAFRRFDKIACAWSTGKDSTLCLYFARQVDPHIPVIFTDTMHHFKETYMFRDELAKDWKLNLIVARAETDYFYEGVDRLECCHKMKTEPFLRTIAQLGFDAVIVGVRRDEHPSRADEDYFSPREGHTRVHPILHWRWREVEEYTIRNGIPRNPLYGMGYTSIGCEPCTSIPKIPGMERSGRDEDKERIMRRLRQLGYF